MLRINTFNLDFIWAYYSNRIFCDIFAIFLIMGIMIYACKEQLENIIGQFKTLLLKSNK